MLYETDNGMRFKSELMGKFQEKNINTVAAVCQELMILGYLCDVKIPENVALIQKEMEDALMNVCELTGLQGRWQKIQDNPTIVCDTGHNIGAWEYLSKMLSEVKCNQMHIVFGMVEDKDIYGVMSLLPKNAIYYFTKGSTKRAMSEQSLQVFGAQFELAGMCYPTVSEAIEDAMKNAQKDDFIFVGGSNYVVADFLKTRL
jgi:dihydrofolate synthase/folylpolyglutamate synthase